MTPLTLYVTMTINLTGEGSDGFSAFMVIQHVATSWTDVSVLVRIPWPKIHRWGLFVTRIDLRSVASMEKDRSILDSTTTFELPSVFAVPTQLHFYVGVAYYAISCGRCVS
ncbi:hypothetical protein TNCT_398911 [Trichonephila clavata]|uniref:Uncharacterized protein n=1 Tax=Trichonephila clavata TaxID=2740835 RepID=A0A8X6JSX8_TRICU|nr:hypothetical protein TNCT_398911 [Trichonephila clavata]